jgi:hypothetical protein
MMTSFLSESLVTWIVAVDIPLATTFFVIFSRFKRDVDILTDSLRERLNAYKLDVAQNYASINHVKDLESRLIAHLLRIETKLDNTTFKIHHKE